MGILRMLKRAVDRLFFWSYRAAYRSVPKHTSKTILVVRTDGIGDLVFFLPYAESMRKLFPDFRLVLCCREESARLARALPIFDDVLDFRTKQQRRNYAYRLRTLAAIRRVGAGIAIYGSYHREQIGDELTLLSGAQRMIALSGNDECIHPAMRSKNTGFYSEIIEVPDHIPERTKYDSLLRALGQAGVQSADDRSIVRKIGERRLPEEYDGWFGSSRSGFAMIAPGGSAAIRRWPASNFSRLADLIIASTGMDVILCGDQTEELLLDEIARGMDHVPRVCSGATITEVISMMSRCSVFVGNESGLLHLAVSLDIPSVGIIGGGHFSRYFPYGSARTVNNPLECYECNWKCPFPEPHCLTDITVQQVMNAFHARMEETL